MVEVADLFFCEGGRIFWEGKWQESGHFFLCHQEGEIWLPCLMGKVTAQEVEYAPKQKTSSLHTKCFLFRNWPKTSTSKRAQFGAVCPVWCAEVFQWTSRQHVERPLTLLVQNGRLIWWWCWPFSNDKRLVVHAASECWGLDQPACLNVSGVKTCTLRRSLVQHKVALWFYLFGTILFQSGSFCLRRDNNCDRDRSINAVLFSSSLQILSTNYSFWQDIFTAQNQDSKEIQKLLSEGILWTWSQTIGVDARRATNTVCGHILYILSAFPQISAQSHLSWTSLLFPHQRLGKKLNHTNTWCCQTAANKHKKP